MKNDTISYRIGVIFTPFDWAKFASKKFDIYKKWMSGSTVFDPTMGSGNLLASLIEIGLDEGLSLASLPINRLYGNELNQSLFSEAVERFQHDYFRDMSSNFTNLDFFDLEAREYDIIFGNPPWMNFTDLPVDYKRKIKPFFSEYDLIEDTKKMLLGGSRIDIAALVIQRAIAEFLKNDGEAYFFQPLSLLLNDGAHDTFRRYSVKGINFSIESVYDFNETAAFHNISTRHGLVHYRKNKKTQFPISFWRNIKDQWVERRAAPILAINSPLSVFDTDAPPPLAQFKPIRIKKSAQPRQGINTSGANQLFFFTSCRDFDEFTCVLNDSILLPKKFIFPLLVSKNFKDDQNQAEKWVLLPYAKSGRPLELKVIKQHPYLWEYLHSHKQTLSSRKGRMIESWQGRGYWWALLGVGKYNFAKYKVVWEAYGRKTFKPIIFSGRWQVNQSLQAYISFNNKSEAKRISRALKNPAIEHYLHSLKMDGTMNWAQPGKIKKLFDYQD